MEQDDGERFKFEETLCDMEVEKVYKYNNRIKDMSEYLEKKEKALKSMQKLLSISERFSKHCWNMIKQESMESAEQDEAAAVNFPTSDKENFAKNLRYFHGTLRPYQVQGVIWLKVLFENAISGILADEMGLGKTVQVIALLCHLIQKDVLGPFLIVVPLSTLSNWKSEFKRFAPEIPVVIFHGDENQRRNLQSELTKSHYINGKYIKPVVITVCHIIRMDIRVFSRIIWKYFVIDEGHCIKNYESQIARNVRSIKCINRLLLTGTPLHNSLTELWALLNFIMPKIFKDMETFSSLLHLGDFQDNHKILQEQENTNIISTIHRILAPFMLRRLKCEVLRDLVPKKEVSIYCPLSTLQKSLYTAVLEHNLNVLTGKKIDNTTLERPLKRKCAANVSYTKYLLMYENPNEVTHADAEENIKDRNKMQPNTNIKDERDVDIENVLDRIRMQNPMMMFKQIVDHPYLVQCPVTPDKKNIIVDERLVRKSGKMLVLDAILPKLKAKGHKILLFSTLVMTLDMIEEYMIMRKYNYCRLDGSFKIEKREQQIDAFNNDPDVFIFLISTRAGGLGLNLVAADTVIFYDRDWNPQSDIQAQDRCHRIGQTKPVMVYTLVTKNTIDESIIERGEMKRKLEKIVIKNGQSKKLKKGKFEIDLSELAKLLESDASVQVHPNGIFYTDKELDVLLDRQELYDKMNK